MFLLPASGLIPHWIAAWSYSTWSPPLETSINFTLQPLPRLSCPRLARPVRQRPWTALLRLSDHHNPLAPVTLTQGKSRVSKITGIMSGWCQGCRRRAIGLTKVAPAAAYRSPPSPLKLLSVSSAAAVVIADGAMPSRPPCPLAPADAPAKL